MDWKELYRQKLTTADEAVKRIKSGDRVVVTHATGESTLLSERDGEETRRLPRW